MDETEIELTYLAKTLPAGIESCESKDLLDIYIPKSAEHPTMRIRNSAGRYLAEVTQEKFVAGGILCGKSYEDIKDDFSKYGYKKL